ncbi:DNA-processing protein DprA [Streptomyces sp. NPDC093984]|uniref:DNA-processing protein DprA n=1 Tax=Streptomyces sp. NPDC093984 TaxID=3366052 RepID=UPI003807C381
MPESTLPERAARAALAAHFAPGQVAADLANYSPAEVWQRHVRRDNSGRLAQYKPREELDKATLTCRFVIPSDEVWPTALADLGPHCPLGLWVRGGDQLPQLTARSIAVTGNRNATEQAIIRAHAFAAAVAGAGYTVTATLAYERRQASVRKCSLRAKGEVGDRWITQVFGGRPFRQITGLQRRRGRPPLRRPGRLEGPRTPALGHRGRHPRDGARLLRGLHRHARRGDPV